jgi:hypothetical protein
MSSDLGSGGLRKFMGSDFGVFVAASLLTALVFFLAAGEFGARVAALSLALAAVGCAMDGAAHSRRFPRDDGGAENPVAAVSARYRGFGGAEMVLLLVAMFIVIANAAFLFVDAGFLPTDFVANANDGWSPAHQLGYLVAHVGRTDPGLDLGLWTRSFDVLIFAFATAIVYLWVAFGIQYGFRADMLKFRSSSSAAALWRSVLLGLALASAALAPFVFPGILPEKPARGVPVWGLVMVLMALSFSFFWMVSLGAIRLLMRDRFLGTTKAHRDDEARHDRIRFR